MPLEDSFLGDKQENANSEAKESETIDTTEIITKSMNLSNKSSNSSSWNVLDCTGIQAESLTNLQSKYEENHEKFFKYLRNQSKRFTEKLKQYDLKTDKLSLKLVQCYYQEIIRIIDKVACYQEFLDMISGCSDDSEEERIINMDNELSALKGLYVIKLEQAEKVIEVLEEESKTQTLEKNAYTPILPYEIPEIRNTNQKEFNNDDSDSEYSESLHDDLIQTGTRRDVNRKSLPPTTNQVSTPIRGTKVRFSEDFMVEDQEDVTIDATWKYIEPKSNNIQEISICEDLQEIDNIIARKISDNLSDLEILSMEKRDRLRLRELKVNLEKKSSTLPVECNANIQIEAVKAFKASTKWLQKLNDILINRNLHLESERKYAKPLDLDRFEGYADTRTNVYEFIKLYEIVSRGFNIQDKSHFLYSNYLSDSLKSEVRHIRGDYIKMKTHLIQRHGNVNHLLSMKRNQIKNLKQVNFKSTKPEKITYIKSVCEVLDQISSLVEVNKKDYPLMHGEVYSYNNVMELAKLLPEFLFRGYSNEYVSEATSKNEECLSGQKSFELLVQYLKKILKDFEFQQENYIERDNKEQKFVKNASKNKQNIILSMKSDNPLDTSKYYGAPCISHQDTKRKVKECLSGKCPTFLQMKPEIRNKMADEKKVCKVCLLYKCKQQSKNVCLLKNILPKAIICEQCENCNILLCANHSHNGPDVKKAISEFLPGFTKNTEIELMMVGKFMKVSKTDVPIPKRISAFAMNVNTGEKIPKSDIQFKINDDISDKKCVYPMQYLNINGRPTLTLFDTGAMGACIKGSLAEELDLTIVDAREQSFSVAGGGVVKTTYPLYEMIIGPNDRDEFESFKLLGMDRISSKISEVDLTDIGNQVRKQLVSFPESKAIYPEKIGGGELELIIGIRQPNIFPTREYVFPDGLQVWRSPLKDIFGSNLIFCGTYEVIENSYNFIGDIPAFFKEEYKVFRNNLCVTDIESISIKHETIENVKDDDETVLHNQHTFIADIIENHYSDSKVTILKQSSIPTTLTKEYEDQENVGCTVDYRCPTCLGCKICKESNQVRAISVKEAAEEELIYKCVEVDIEKKESSCVYPFIKDPQEYLSELWNKKSDNMFMAKEVFETQRRKSEDTRKSVVNFHSELSDKGYVSSVKDLPKDQRNEIETATFKHVFCWRTVFKPDSVSTPARMVLDPTVCGFNNILAKGVCCLNNLYQLVIHFRSNLYVFTSDISKMYNSVKLKPEMFKFSLYLMSQTLDPKEDYELWCHRSLMYGIRPAGNIATCALRKTAALKEKDFTYAPTTLTKRTYMDDSQDGSNKKEIRDEMAKEVEELVPYGGFRIKVITKNFEDPSEKASSDGVSTSFGGYKWLPKSDKLKLKFSEVNFNVKRRGFKKPNKNPVETASDIRDLVKDMKFTKKMMLSKTLEVYDPLGTFEPVKVRLKLDLQVLSGLDFNTQIPIDQRKKWIENLILINDCRDIEVDRAVVPLDAENPDTIELIVCADAAATMCGCAVYTRFKLRNGGYSVQLLSGRSKTTMYSIPRNELHGCLLAASTAFTIVKALEGRVNNILFTTDSTICVCWLSNKDARLKQFVNTRVQATLRLIGDNQFYHIPGSLNPADLLTKPGVTINDVRTESVWNKGMNWMKIDRDQMPLKSYEDICSSLTTDDEHQVDKEIHPTLPAIHNIGEIVELPEEFCFDDDLLHSDCHCKLLNDCPKQNLESFMKVTPKTEKKVDETKTKDSVKKAEGLYPVNFIKFGFLKAFTQFAYVIRFILKIKHKYHQNEKNNLEYDPNCKICKVTGSFKPRGLSLLAPDKSKEQSRCSPLDFYVAWHQICKIGSKETKLHYKKKPAILNDFDEIDGVLHSAGRLSYPDVRIETTPKLHETNFFQPVFTVTSEVTYSIVMYVHWILVPHSGVERTLNQVLKIIHVPKLRKLVKYIRETCPRCRYLLKKHYLPAIGNQSAYSLMQAPPFFCAMADICGTYTAYDSIRKRVSKPAYFLVVVCLCTGAVSIGVLEDLTTTSVILALSRCAYRYGWTKFLCIDNQTSFKALESMKINFKDLSGKMWESQKMILDFNTPLAHQSQGRIESKIKVLKEFLTKSGELGKRHTYIEWETICLHLSSVINGLPICVNSDDRSDTLSEYGLICPNMFLIGRNNNRAPEKFVTLEINPAKALQELGQTNERLTDLLGTYVHRFIPGQRYTNFRPPEIGDIVLFIAKEADRKRNVHYKYGRICSTNVDGREDKVTISYRNATEVVMRTVDRKVKDLVLIIGSDDLDFNTYEHQLASWVQQKYL